MPHIPQITLPQEEFDCTTYIQEKAIEYIATKEIKLLEIKEELANTVLQSMMKRVMKDQNKKHPFAHSGKYKDAGFKDNIVWESLMHFDSVADFDKVIFITKDTDYTNCQFEFKEKWNKHIAIISTGIQADSLLFQYVSGSFASRIEFLENRNRVTVLATPLILTANKEVSRIFAGVTLPITTGFSEPGTVTAGENLVVIPGSAQTQQQDIGTALLITPSINADRTVTLQILQEISEIQKNGAVIPISDTRGNVSDHSIDVVRRRSFSGTVVAKDGLAVAVGGLIEESVGSFKEGIPLVGEIPIIGMLFRREESNRSRRELVILIRPYIFNTAADSEKVSQELLEELSLHPKVSNLKGTLDAYGMKEVPNGETPLSDLHGLFNFHAVKTKNQEE
jgi:Flp pilus assembly secretin CpaC